MEDMQFQSSIESVLLGIFKQLNKQGEFMESNVFDLSEYGIYVPEVNMDDYPEQSMTHLYSIMENDDEYVFIVIANTLQYPFKTFIILKNGKQVLYYKQELYANSK